MSRTKRWSVFVVTGAALMLASGLRMLGQGGAGRRGSETKESRGKLPEAPPIGFFGGYHIGKTHDATLKLIDAVIANQNIKSKTRNHVARVFHDRAVHVGL